MWGNLPCPPSIYPVCRAIRYGPDEEGINGIFLGKNVVTEASKGLKHVLTKIGPKVDRRGGLIQELSSR